MSHIKSKGNVMNISRFKLTKNPSLTQSYHFMHTTNKNLYNYIYYHFYNEMS